MNFFSESDFELSQNIAGLNFVNPFLPERIELERDILGQEYRDIGIVWSLGKAQESYQANILRINDLALELLNSVRTGIINSNEAISKKEFYLYEDMLAYYLYNKYLENFHDIIIRQNSQSFQFFNQFLKDLQYFLYLPQIKIPPQYDPAHLFAIFFQAHRAFYYIFDFIVGSSLATAKLRANIWQSVFTHDIRRYQRSVFNKMRDFTTLITGPSGTGKELVAQAISLSAYIPFDPKKLEFKENYLSLFCPLHLSAMSQNLLESELFGHKKGAYTGALNDRSGWLELCSAHGTVFLDEIGEINEEIQVKLLRVLQNRIFQRLGDNDNHQFQGKIIAATNRDLEDEIKQQHFRSDLYYRLCSDIITTPSLHEQLTDSPEEINIYVRYLSEKLVGPDEAPELSKETIAWIDKNLGKSYSWPGNVRELEQCVRNILIRGSYTPAVVDFSDDNQPLASKLNKGLLTVEELLTEYCSIVYQQTGSYVETAKRLDMDRRTAKKYIDMK